MAELGIPSDVNKEAVPRSVASGFAADRALNSDDFGESALYNSTIAHEEKQQLPKDKSNQANDSGSHLDQFDLNSLSTSDSKQVSEPSLRPRYKSIDDAMKGTDPFATDPSLLQFRQLTYGIIAGVRDKLVPFTEPDQVNGALGHVALGAVLAFGLSIGFTRLAYAAPQLTAVISKGLKYGFLADIAVRGAEMAYDQADTYLHPENFLQNSYAEANIFGSGIVDYTTVGVGGAFGFFAGERLFGLNGAAKSIYFHLPSDDVPSLQYRPFRHISTASDEPKTTAAAELYREVQNSVVQVNNGSGFIVDGENGYIATNNHVSQGKLQPTATTASGEKLELKLIARDRAADITFYKTAVRPETPLPQVQLAESSNLSAGDSVYPVGYPLSASQAYLTKVTMDTHIIPPSLTARVNERPAAYIEGTGPTLPGMSGSAYFNSERQVVGQVARYDKEQNKSMGSTVEHLNEVLRQVRAHEPYEGWLEIKSQVSTFKNAAGKDEITLPINVTSTAALRNREQLAKSAAGLFKPHQFHYSRSRDLGAYRGIGSSAAVLFGQSMIELSEPLLLVGTNDKERGH